MKPFTAPNRPFCVKPFAPLMHQPRSVINVGLVYWGSHESEPQKAQKHQTQQLGCVSCLRVGILEVGLLGFGHSLITGHQRAAVLEDEVDDTYYSIVEYNGGMVTWVIAFQSDALDCRGGPSASL